MDALIRSATLTTDRLRLGHPTRAPAASAAVEQSPVQALREQIERQVRGELEQRLREILDSERAAARTDGYANGLAEGRAAAAAESSKLQQQLQERFANVISALERNHAAGWERLQAAAGEIAFTAVCRLVGRKAASEQFVLGLIEQACVPLRMETSAAIRMHPRDLQLLRDLLHEGELRVRGLGLKVIADESLQIGGCVIESATGEYDGGLEQQLRRLHAIVTSQDTSKPLVAVRARASEG